MALSQKHRVALYELLLPQVGDEVTEAFLAEFPAGEGEALVTNTLLRAEMAELRGELRTEMAGLRTEMHVLSAATNRRMTTVALGVTGVLLTAGGVMTTVLISALG